VFYQERLRIRVCQCGVVYTLTHRPESKSEEATEDLQETKPSEEAAMFPSFHELHRVQQRDPNSMSRRGCGHQPFGWYRAFLLAKVPNLPKLWMEMGRSVHGHAPGQEQIETCPYQNGSPAGTPEGQLPWEEEPFRPSGWRPDYSGAGTVRPDGNAKLYFAQSLIRSRPPQALNTS